MKISSMCGLDNVFALHSSEPDESIDLIANELASILFDPKLMQQFSESCHESLSDFVVARHLQRLSRPDIDLKVFKRAVRAAYTFGDDRRMQFRRTWGLMSKSPESFIQRLKTMIAVNNILEVMDAVFVAQSDGVRLEANELLKLAVMEKIKKQSVGPHDYAVIRFLIEGLSLDVTATSAKCSESALDYARRSGDAELVQFLQKASGGDTPVSEKIGRTGLPARFEPLISRCVTETRSRLKKGESILSHAYVGNTQTGRLKSLPSVPKNDTERKIADETIRKIAEAENADFILMVSESWSVTFEPSSRPGHHDRKSGNLFAPPRVVETCTFKLETSEGIWLALAEIKQKGHSKKGKTINEVVFARAEKDSEGDCSFYRAETDCL